MNYTEGKPLPLEGCWSDCMEPPAQTHLRIESSRVGQIRKFLTSLRRPVEQVRSICVITGSGQNEENGG